MLLWSCYNGLAGGGALRVSYYILGSTRSDAKLIYFYRETPGDFVTYMGAFNVYIRAERLVDYCEYITVQFATVGEKEGFGHIILGLLDKMLSPEEAFEAFIADGDTLEICGEADDTITNYKIDIPA
jgi:hypothetical protein